jgi:hypothetical protein
MCVAIPPFPNTPSWRGAQHRDNHAMKTYWGVEVYLYVFLTSPLDGSEWSASRPGRFTPGTHWIEGYVGHTAGLEAVAKRKILSPRQELNPGRLAPSQELYRLSYPGPQ